MAFRTAVTALAVTAVSAAVCPAAQAATLKAAKPCFGDGDPIVLHGTGFTPGGAVVLAGPGAPSTLPPADGHGNIFTRFSPVPLRATQETAYAISDGRQEATSTFTRASLRVTVTGGGRQGFGLRTIRAAGFTAGTGLYMHTVRKGRARTVRLGALTGACHDLTVRERIFSRKSKKGRYVVQFDTARRYSATAAQKIRFNVRVK